MEEGYRGAATGSAKEDADRLFIKTDSLSHHLEVLFFDVFYYTLVHSTDYRNIAYFCILKYTIDFAHTFVYLCFDKVRRVYSGMFPDNIFYA